MKFVPKTQVDKRLAEAIASEYGISDLAAEILAGRGYDLESCAEYLYPDEDMIIPPFEFDAMGEICERIEQAIAEGETIAIYSDYDTDGISAAAIMYRCLRELGTTPIVYVPDRFTEGYGTNPRAITELCKEASLIITVDCGIRSVADVELAASLGTDVIITDHHECGELPDTPYILNPKREGENYPFKVLCGAGIAFKLAYALIDDEEKLRELMQYASIATIADMVPLIGENRTIAALGLRYINEAPALGIKALMEAIDPERKVVDSYSVGFMLSPRINAAGRMASGRIALEMLITDDEKRAEECAAELCALNQKRQRLQSEVAEKCAAELKDINLTNTGIIMVCGDEFEEGIVGLAASALVERFYRPSIVFKRKDNLLIGSARSIEGIDIYSVLNSCSDLFIKFGGHEQAAGLTLEEKNFDELKLRANEYIKEKYSNDVFVRKIEYDVEIDPSRVTLDDVEGLSILEPYGEANPHPVFYVRKAELTGIRRIGAEGRHAKMRINDCLNMIYFGAPSISEDTLADLAGELSVNEYNSRRTVQFRATHFFRHTSSGMTDEKEKVRSFIKEINCLAKIMNEPQKYRLYRSAEEFKNAVLKRAEDPLGMVITAATDIGKAALKAMEFQDIETFYGEGAENSCENAIYIDVRKNGAFKNYNDVFICGHLSAMEEAGDAHILMNSGLFKAYKALAAKYYVPSEEHAKYYRAFASAPMGDTISSILVSMIDEDDTFTFEKLWYMLNVFCEQKLIEIKKSDKIIFKPNMKAQRRSITKYSFETVLK